MKDSLGIRMKQYERINRNYLMRRNPVIIRLDGKSFHTFTKGLKRPFDDVLIESMQETAKYLCENIQGCKLAYHQSDEISLLLTDYENINTQGWFDYNIQKITSISASMCTLIFNKTFKENIDKFYRNNIAYKQSAFNELSEIELNGEYKNKYDKFIEDSKYFNNLNRDKSAFFDARCFSLPKEEVCNYFICRQLDAIRNSIQLVGQSNFSHKELFKKSCNDIQNMLLTQKDINWNNYKTFYKRGSCVKKTIIEDKSKWIIDKEIPIFAEDRGYIEQYVFDKNEFYKRG